MQCRALIGAAAVVFAAAACPARAGMLAQVAPAKLNLTVRRGEPVTRDVVVTNQGDVPVVVRPRWSDLLVDGAGNLALLPPGSLPASLAGSVHLEPVQFSLQPGESGVVRVTVTLPLEGPRTRWGVLLSEVRPAVATPCRLGPRVAGQLGTTIYLSDVPPDRIHAELVSLEASSVGTDSIAVHIGLRNGGERHFYASGQVSLSDSSSTVVRSGSLPIGVVLPGVTRLFTWNGEAGLAPGRYRLTATLDSGEPELLVGETWIDWRGGPGGLEHVAAAQAARQ
jgi:hypothetical protein